MGTKIRATTSIIFNVRGLDEELYIVILYELLILDGNISGYSPVTPKNVALTIVRHDENQAFHHCFLCINNLDNTRPVTVNKGIINKTGIWI
jgi:hypothetical protein